MKSTPFKSLLILAAIFLSASTLRGAVEPPSTSDADTSKKDKDSKPAKEEAEYNSPPKGATLIAKGQIIGQITKGSDGKTFSMDVLVSGKKKEIEINLAAYTKVRLAKQSEFDDRGNPKRSAPTISAGTHDDLRGGMKVVVNLSGTRDGKWLVAKTATILGE